MTLQRQALPEGRRTLLRLNVPRAHHCLWDIDGGSTLESPLSAPERKFPFYLKIVRERKRVSVFYSFGFHYFRINVFLPSHHSQFFSKS